MSEVSIERLESDRFVIKGALSFETAPDVLRQGIDLFRDASRVILDLDGVSRADSAGLALLVEWMRFARRSDKQISFMNVPEQLLHIAEASSIEEILPLHQG